MSDIEKQARHNNTRGYLHDFGKLFIDVAKLAFGSLVLGTIIRWDIPHTTIFVLGVISSVVIATVGIILARKYKEE
ncbi:MAG: hypothetical protein LBB89_07145 [Treponema sp.]|nr:hypothetical protein [Treponema sp.]